MDAYTAAIQVDHRATDGTMHSACSMILLILYLLGRQVGIFCSLPAEYFNGSVTVPMQCQQQRIEVVTPDWALAGL